jgi:hypothetical protein
MRDLHIHLNVALYTFETPPPPVLFACAAPATPFWDWGICPELLTCPDCQREAPPVTRPRIALDPQVLHAMQCMPPTLAGDGGTVYWPLGLVWRRLRVPREQRTWLKLQLDLAGWLSAPGDGVPGCDITQEGVRWLLAHR